MLILQILKPPIFYHLIKHGNKRESSYMMPNSFSGMNLIFFDNVQMEFLENVFQKKKLRKYCGTTMVLIMEATLAVNELQQKSYKVVFIGLLYSRTSELLLNNVTNVKELETSLGRMRCLSEIS